MHRLPQALEHYVGGFKHLPETSPGKRSLLQACPDTGPQTIRPSVWVHMCLLLQCNHMTSKSQVPMWPISSPGVLSRGPVTLAAIEEQDMLLASHTKQLPFLQHNHRLYRCPDSSQSTFQDTINKMRSHIKRLKPINISFLTLPGYYERELWVFLPLHHLAVTGHCPMGAEVKQNGFWIPAFLPSTVSNQMSFLSSGVCSPSFVHALINKQMLFDHVLYTVFTTVLCR